MRELTVAIWLGLVLLLAGQARVLEGRLSPPDLLVPGTDSSLNTRVADAQFGPNLTVPVLLTGPARAVDAEGRFVEEWGVSPVPGLFFIGRSWQTSRGSALVTGVGRDAVEIAGRIDAALGRAPMPDSPPDLVATAA